MKEFRDPWSGGEDHTIKIYISDDNSNELIVDQFAISLNGQGGGWVSINIIPFLKMTASEYAGLLNSLSSIDTVEEVYGLKQKELGIYLRPLIPLFSIQSSNTVIDLVYEDSYNPYSLRKVDLSDNSIIESLSTYKECARFIIKTLIEFYDKNKDKVAQ